MINLVNAPSDVKDFIECSRYLKTDDGLFFCVDDEKFYDCSVMNTDEESFKCYDSVLIKDFVSASNCPFDHVDCNVTVDMSAGWGVPVSDVTNDYKLSVFHEDFHCGNGVCFVPFFFKSNKTISGKLDFKVTSNTILSDIVFERVLDKSNEPVAVSVSMEQFDVYYYNLYFSYEPELVGGLIKKAKSVKFNISAFLDGKKVLELDPVAYESVSGGTVTYLDDGFTWNHNITCANDLILLVGVATDSDSADAISGIEYNGTALTKVDSVDSGDGQVVNDYWYLLDPDCGAEEAVVVTGTAHEDAAGISTVYSGVKGINVSSVKSNSSSADIDYASIKVVTSTVNEVVVDFFALDTDGEAIVGGDNQEERHELDENSVQLSTSDGYDDDGIVNMNWSGFGDEWVLIGAPLLPYEPPNIPVFTDNPDPVTVGENITYNGTSTDPSGLNYKLSVCRTNNITNSYPGECESIDWDIMDDEGDGTPGTSLILLGDTNVNTYINISHIIFTPNNNFTIERIHFFVDSTSGSDYGILYDVYLCEADSNDISVVIGCQLVKNQFDLIWSVGKQTIVLDDYYYVSSNNNYTLRFVCDSSCTDDDDVEDSLDFDSDITTKNRTYRELDTGTRFYSTRYIDVIFNGTQTICTSSITGSGNEAKCDYNVTSDDISPLTAYGFSCNNHSVCSASNSTNTTVSAEAPPSIIWGCSLNTTGTSYINCSDNCNLVLTDVAQNIVYLRYTGFVQGLRNVSNSSRIRIDQGCRART